MAQLNLEKNNLWHTKIWERKISFSSFPNFIIKDGFSPSGNPKAMLTCSSHTNCSVNIALCDSFQHFSLFKNKKNNKSRQVLKRGFLAGVTALQRALLYFIEFDFVGWFGLEGTSKPWTPRLVQALSPPDLWNSAGFQTLEDAERPNFGTFNLLQDSPTSRANPCLENPALENQNPPSTGDGKVSS